MSYRIDSHHGGEGPREEISAFLAAFVRDGHLASPKPGDGDPDQWLRRFRWWWSENPACREEDPTALVLREEGGGIAGFLGFIPAAYERDGEAVPSLVSTTLFVAPSHRGASMGLVGRLRALARRYQIVDGSPSPEMVRLLERLGYEHAGIRMQYLLPAAVPGGRLLRRALRLAYETPGLEGARLVGDPAEIARIPERRDGTLRRALDRKGLAWMLRSGSEPRRFAGLLDPDGELLACGLLFAKERRGLAWAVLADYADFVPGGAGLACLLARVCERPEACGLDPKTRFLAWSVFAGEERPGARGLLRRSSIYCQRPEAWQACPREFRPVEGDLALL